MLFIAVGMIHAAVVFFSLTKCSRGMCVVVMNFLCDAFSAKPTAAAMAEPAQMEGVGMRRVGGSLFLHDPIKSWLAGILAGSTGRGDLEVAAGILVGHRMRQLSSSSSGHYGELSRAVQSEALSKTPVWTKTLYVHGL